MPARSGSPPVKGGEERITFFYEVVVGDSRQSEERSARQQ
jgi:hypothetical protein